jgi:hypothetical protein
MKLMKTKRWIAVAGLIAFAPVAFAPVALADDNGSVVNADTATNSPTGSSEPSQPTEPSTYDKISKHVALTYFNILRGAPLSDVSNRYQPAPDGTLDTTNTQNLESTVTAGWKFSKDWMFGAYTHFFYSPLGNPTAYNNANMQWLDPALVLSKANMVSIGGLKIKGQLSATFPMSPYDTLQKNGLITGITPTANILYDIPKTKLTLGLYTYVTAYIPGSNAIENYRTMKLIMAPNANYQITKSFAATLWVDAIQVRRFKHSGFFSGMNNPDMDIEPGVNWDITPYLSFNPFLNIYPSAPTMNASSLQAVIAGKIF